MEELGRDNGSAGVLHEHFKMYKPAGVLSQFIFNHRKRRNRTLLGDVMKNSGILVPAGIMAIGRLDEDSEGLLLLTTDGQLSKRVRDKAVEKEYWVQVRGQVTHDAICKLCNGVRITLPLTDSGDDNGDGNSRTYQTLPCKARILDTEIVEVTEPTTLSDENKRIKSIKKFKGVCNKCSEYGHKSKDCHMRSNTKQTDSGPNIGLTAKTALPRGIVPSNRRLSTEQPKHGETSWISITVTEGKNRQVRRMTHAVGHPTLRLVRMRIGSIVLDEMIGGDVKSLTQSEVDSFK